MIDKERLEEIKNSYLEGLHRLFGTPWVSMPKENFDFLIKQAKRVEKLETQYERYKQALEEIMRTETVTTALAEGQVAYTFSGHIARQALEGEK